MIIMHREQVERVRSGELTSVLVEYTHPYHWKVGAIHAVKTCMSGRPLAYVRVVEGSEEVRERGSDEETHRLKPVLRPAEASGTQVASGTGGAVLVRERVYFELVTVFDYMKQEYPGWNGRHG